MVLLVFGGFFRYYKRRERSTSRPRPAKRSLYPDIIKTSEVAEAEAVPLDQSLSSSFVDQSLSTSFDDQENRTLDVTDSTEVNNESDSERGLWSSSLLARPLAMWSTPVEVKKRQPSSFEAMSPSKRPFKKRPIALSPVKRQLGLSPVKRQFGLSPVKRQLGLSPVKRQLGLSPVKRQLGLSQIGRAHV